MRENFDRLSKNLAAGMSRREAFWRFFAGALAVVGAVKAIPAAAQGQGQQRGPFNGYCSVDPPGPPSNSRDQCEPCAQYCADLYGHGTADFVECVVQSKACAPEECGFRAYNSWMCISAY
jgi:hypothetical protein